VRVELYVSAVYVEKTEKPRNSSIALVSTYGVCESVVGRSWMSLGIACMNDVRRDMHHVGDGVTARAARHSQDLAPGNKWVCDVTSHDASSPCNVKKDLRLFCNVHVLTYVVTEVNSNTIII
jgi:hypothetical protein